MSIKKFKPTSSDSSFTDRLIREDERRELTSLSRSQAYVLEQKGLFPRRIKLGSRSNVWKLSQILAWIEQQGEGDE